MAAATKVAVGLTSKQREKLVMAEVRRYVQDGYDPMDAARMAILGQVYEGPVITEMMALSFGVEGAAARFYRAISEERENAIHPVPPTLVESRVIERVAAHPLPSTSTATNGHTSAPAKAETAKEATRVLPVPTPIRPPEPSILDIPYPTASGKWLQLRYHRRPDVLATARKHEAMAKGNQDKAQIWGAVGEMLPDDDVQLGTFLGEDRVIQLLQGAI